MRTIRFGPALVGGACALFAPFMAVAQSPPPAALAALHDRTFLISAIMGDNAQIALGQMAEKGGAAINSLGVMLVQECNQSRDQARKLAKAQGMVPPEQVSPKASQDYAKLEQLSGPQFNTAFIRYMIKADRKAIRAYRREAKGQGPVANLARSTLPSLQAQLRVAVGLAQQAGA